MRMSELETFLHVLRSDEPEHAPPVAKWDVYTIVSRTCLLVELILLGWVLCRLRAN